MKSISIDFTNNMLCFMTEGQQGTKSHPNLNKDKFDSFFPDKNSRENYSSYTWNFEDETFSCNQSYHKLGEDEIMTKDRFVPETIKPMKGLCRRYKEFTALLGYEEVNLNEELMKKLPEETKKLFGR